MSQTCKTVCMHALYACAWVAIMDAKIIQQVALKGFKWPDHSLMAITHTLRHCGTNLFENLNLHLYCHFRRTQSWNARHIASQHPQACTEDNHGKELGLNNIHPFSFLDVVHQEVQEFCPRAQLGVLLKHVSSILHNPCLHACMSMSQDFARLNAMVFSMS